MSDNLKRALTVYRVSDDESGNICSLFDDLSSIVSMSTSYEEIPAASDLFGVAINLLLSDTVQAVTTLVAVGDILWRIVSFLKKSGKYFSVDKPAVKCLVPSLLNKDADVDHEALKKAKIWGPMVIASSAGSLIDGTKPSFSTLWLRQVSDGYCVTERTKEGPNKVVHHLIRR